MKVWSFIVIVFALVLSSENSLAQCDYKVDLTSTTQNGYGEISLNINNPVNYRCVLYVYHEGQKSVENEKEGSARTIDFKNLKTERYYSVAIYFEEQDNALCSSWISEPIPISE
jgi:hypothetical protein